MPRFAFRFEPTYRTAAGCFGIRPDNSWVEVEGGALRVRFGPWRLRSPLGNIAGTELTGPYQLLKTIGPPHLSFADRGIACVTNRDRGLCVTFTDPVRGIDPFGLIRHPGATLTVEDLDGLREALATG